MRTLLTLGLAAVLAAACASETPTISPTTGVPSTATASPSGGFIGGPSGGPSVVEPSGSPGMTPTPTGPAEPSPSPSPTPVSFEPGLGWTAPATSGLDDAELRAVVATPAGWLAVGRSTDTTSPPAWSSPDGIGWTRAPADAAFPAGAEIVALVAGGPGYVAAGTIPAKTVAGAPTVRAAVFTSTDGVAWSLAEGVKGGNDSELRALLATGSGFLAVGRAGKTGSAGWYSADGLTWTRSTKNPMSEPITVMNGLSAGGRGFVVVGQGPMGAAVWTSVDGVRWRREADGPSMHRGVMRAVVQAPGGLVAIGDNIWTSKDGVKWTSLVEPTLQTPELRALVQTSDGLIAVGGDRVGGAAAMVSADGRTWMRAAPQDALGQAQLFAIAAGTGGQGGSLAVGGSAVGAVVRGTPPEAP